VSGQGSLLLHALPQLDLELLPAVTWGDGEWRYAFNAPGTLPDYNFGRLLARSLSATLRASYTFTPQLSLQIYAQAFLASGNYRDVRAVGTSAAGELISRSQIAGSPLATLTANTDFEQAALNANVVLRWEYRLGSTLFLVYSRSQVPAVSTLSGPAGLDLHALGQRASADVILFKLSYWWSS
jgi:hypothetical protein